MKTYIIKIITLALLLFSSVVYACGDNLNAIAQGPFKDGAFANGFVCFQNTPDKRDMDFYLSYTKNGMEHNVRIDTFHYSDAPVELISVFFMSFDGVRNIVVLLRWNVNYEDNDIEYPYYYEVKAYKEVKEQGYINNLDANKDSALSGYQTKNNGKITNFPLDDAVKIKHYLRSKYGV